MNGRTIVFDLDGTLVDTAPDLVEALSVSLALENLPPLPIDIARNLIGGGVGALVRRGLEQHGRTVSETRFNELQSAFLAYYEQHLADKSVPFPGLEQTLDLLAADGARLAVCTNKIERYARLVLDQLGLTSRFQAICGGDTFAAHKPDPMHLLGTIERAGGSVEEAVMIGDSDTDVGAARAAGVPIILVDFGYTDIPARELDSDRVISHLDTLPAAIIDVLSRQPGGA